MEEWINKLCYNKVDRDPHGNKRQDIFLSPKFLFCKGKNMSLSSLRTMFGMHLSLSPFTSNLIARSKPTRYRVVPQVSKNELATDPYLT
jgi:hypothetical protein